MQMQETQYREITIKLRSCSGHNRAWFEVAGGVPGVQEAAEDQGHAPVNCELQCVVVALEIMNCKSGINPVTNLYTTYL
jgi:hypothetical protein